MAEFRTKARAIELLGKGQIADLPTAITELWKNGYDAYADKMGCNLYLEGYKDVKYPFLVIYDDGKGMGYNDLFEKWIVIGTDSKVRGDKEKKGIDTLYKEPRIPIGEKGIGRLSVSYLGSIMLMLTKKRNEPCQVVFFHWDILSNFNLFLDQISIPISNVEKSTDFRVIFNNLKSELLSNFENYDNAWNEHLDLIRSIKEDINSINIPSFFEEEILSELLQSESNGTKIVILNPITEVIELSTIDLRNSTNESSINYIRASLSGISNVFKINKDEKPLFETGFWIFTKNAPWDIISQREFFTEDDFKLADHIIDGRIDNEGFFKGEIRVYNQTINHTYRNQVSPGIRPYGPFEIKLGYLPGRGEGTRLNDEQYAELNQKIKKFGGLYIYRDGFRVLPYGRTTNDFLDFEERRSRGAGYYFFSHRRMFGYIDISREKNSELKDKSGREGFINNIAFREFKNDLISLFIDISTTYFKSQSENEAVENLNLRNKQQRELLKAKQIEETERAKEINEKKEFIFRLNKNKDQLSDIEKQLHEIYGALNKWKENNGLFFEDLDNLFNMINKKEEELRNILLRKPKRFALTNNEENSYLLFLEQYDQIKNGVMNNCKHMASSIQESLEDEKLKIIFRKKYEEYRSQLFAKYQELNNQLSNSFEKINHKLKDGYNIHENDFVHKSAELIPKETITKKAIKESINYLDDLFNNIFDSFNEKYGSLIKHIEQINPEIDEDLLVGYYKSKYNELNKKVAVLNETAQLGMSIEIIDHQFNVLYAQLSNSIAMLKKNAYDNKNYFDIYEQFKSSFQQLELNHKLLTPLYRTTRRTRRKITGQEICEYLRKFFGKVLAEDNIQLEISKSFEKFSIFTYESIVNPVFINIINNSIYWLKSKTLKNISITYEDSKILIMNSGEPIRPADLEHIFGLFFTRKPDGRGIGLYLARTNLRTIGWDIYATNDKKYNRLNGACFVIEEYKGDDNAF